LGAGAVVLILGNGDVICVMTAAWSCVGRLRMLPHLFIDVAMCVWVFIRDGDSHMASRRERSPVVDSYV
jgi:hypothetical protein